MKLKLFTTGCSHGDVGYAHKKGFMLAVVWLIELGKVLAVLFWRSFGGICVLKLNSMIASALNRSMSL